MRTLAVTAALAATLLIGCTVSNNSHGDGDDVKIATPFGGLQVKTNDADVLGGIGLPAYPGATLVKKDKINGKDNGSADVNLSFGSFQLKVKAAEYRTGDDPQKVLGFYRKALGRYGTVIQCNNDRPVGTPVRTSEGLTCEDDHHSHSDDGNGSHGVHIVADGDSAFDGGAKVQLKAGSRKHQHIVDINPDHGGTRFGLVSLDLPTDFHFGDSADKEDRPEKAEKPEQEERRQ